MTFMPTGSTGPFDIQTLIKQARAQQAFAALGQMGGGLMAASMGGLRPRDRALLMGQGFQGANQQLAQGVGPLEQMQIYTMAQKIQAQQAEAERRARIERGIQGLMGSQAQAQPPSLGEVEAQTGQMGPTVGNAAQQGIMAQEGASPGGGLMGQGGGLMDPMARLYAEADPEGFLKSRYEQSLKGQEPYNLSPGQKRFVGGREVAGLPANQPTSVEEYNFAKQQGFQGSYFDFVKQKAEAGRSTTNVNVGQGRIGSIPPGYEVVEEGGKLRMQPIPGGPVATEQAGAAEAAATKQGQRETQAGIVVEDIDRALELVETSDLPVTGLVGLATADIPGTPSHDVSKLLQSVKAAASFDRLQQMRDSSPTGGALGQVSNIEIGLLSSAIGNLEQSQSKEQFVRNLKRVREVYLDIIHGKGNRPDSGDDLSPDELQELEQLRQQQGGSGGTGGGSISGSGGIPDLELSADGYPIIATEAGLRIGDREVRVGNKPIRGPLRLPHMRPAALGKGLEYGPFKTTMQERQLRFDNIESRGRTSLKVPLAKRTDREWKYIEHFIEAFGTPDSAWVEAERQLRAYRGSGGSRSAAPFRRPPN